MADTTPYVNERILWKARTEIKYCMNDVHAPR